MIDICNIRNLSRKLAAVSIAAVSTLGAAQSTIPLVTPAITLAPAAGQADTSPSIGTLAPRLRNFADAKAGKSSQSEALTFNFHAATRLTGISATGDFHVTGGTCIEGHSYAEGNVCSVEVTFKPTGPGHRTGALSIAHSASATPMLTPIGGTAYAPVVSFIPSQITTVPGTYSSGGTLSNPKGLAVDGGDNLYIADTGNHLIKKIDSSGTIQTLIGGGNTSLLNTNDYGPHVKLNAPYGVAVDYIGQVYFSDEGDLLVGNYYDDTIAGRVVGGGPTNASSCTTTSPCTNPNGVDIGPPTSIAVDSSANLYLSNVNGGGFPGTALAEYTPNTLDYFNLGSTNYNLYSQSYAVGVDPFGYGNLYYTYDDPGGPILSPTPLCYILGQNSAYSQNATSGQRFWTVAGAGTCGFSGDGGQAAGAEIGGTVGAFAWDAAGNFYFTDTANNRVRRVDGTTGFIYTVAGNGSVGFGGDGGPATTASLNTPFGLAVDSQGRVYFTNLAGTSPAAEVRVVGTKGAIAFSSTNVSTPSAVKTVLLSNTGNETLYFTRATISGVNASDFAIDPNTTNCNFSGYIENGQSCTIGVIFTPSASGTRSSVLTVLDNTVAGSNLIQLTGTGASAAGKGALSPTSTTFAATTVGVASAAKTVTLTNSGAGALSVGSFSFSGTNAADFSQTNTCGTSVAASASCTISITFTPAASGARSASLAIVTGGGTLTEALSGTGAAAATAGVFSPTSLTFASQTVGTASATQVLTLKNPSSSTLTLSGYTLAGANPTSFTQTHTCGVSLTPGGSCTYTVTFKPTAAGALSATLTANTGGGPATANLTGTGAAAAVKPKVSLTPKANPAPMHQVVVLSSKVASGTANQPTPSGKVQLKEGNHVLAEVDLVTGSATFRLMNLSTGTHLLTASYLGDKLHPASESAVVRQVVGSRLVSTLP